MPDANGELLYSEAVALGLYPTYGPEAGNAEMGMATYGVDGPIENAHFGTDQGAGIVRLPR